MNFLLKTYANIPIFVTERDLGILDTVRMQKKKNNKASSWQHQNTDVGIFYPLVGSLKAANITNEKAILTLGGLKG